MFEIDKQKFGSFVSQLRKEKGLTQKDLAQKLYISDKAISKWETGVSIPDVVLLIPLSEALGVTVTELLQCQRLENPEPMDKARVEELVKTAIAYSDEEQKANRPNRKKRLPFFIGFLVFASIETLAVAFWCSPSEQINTLLVMEVMMAFFAGYFLLFMQEKLPRYYDENPIRYFNDGFMKMNLPGITFHNRNWPHIRKAGTVSCLVILVVYPLIFLISEKLVPASWIGIKVALVLIPTLGGLIIPMYMAGRIHK